MKRNILISFATGSLVTSLAWLLGQTLTQTDEAVPLLVLSDKDSIDRTEMSGMSTEEIGVALSSAGFARKCDAASFVTDWDGGSHTEPKTFVEVTVSNTETLNCILEGATKEGFPVNISFEAL